MSALDPKAMIAEAITEHWGERCLDVDPDCICCTAWQYFDALAAPSGQATLEGVDRVERLAQWLHDEVDYPDPDFPNYSWPDHPDDTGQRGDGWLKIVPKDVQEQFRDIARRLACSALLPPASGAVEAGSWTVHDWEYTDPDTGRWNYARTPERAERLIQQGIKLTPVYTRLPAAPREGK